MPSPIRPLLLFVCLSMVVSHGWADIRLPHLVSDGMVLQRDADVSVWGWGDPGEDIELSFRDQQYQARVNNKGEWRIQLPKMEAGGPFTMVLNGNNRIELEDVMVGEVWLASGQSNMELTMARVKPLYGRLMAEADNARIREFTVPDRYDFQGPRDHLEGGEWRSVTHHNISDFSAVAYFFARELHEQYDLPVGIINASLGGSPVEAWLSEEALKAFPEHLKEAERFKEPELIEQIEKEDQARANEWYQTRDQKDRGLENGEPRWLGKDVNLDEWRTFSVPGYWPEAEDGPVNGVFWFRKTVEIPSHLHGQPADLDLGRIVDADVAYVNGIQVGNTTYQYPPRRYTVPTGVLRTGENIIAARVTSQSGRGGFFLDKPYELRIGQERFDLKGDWHYRVGATMPPLGSQTFVRWKPTGLFNAMISPLVNYGIRGAIWYQGESNVGQAEEYRDMFADMIGEWRGHWGQGDFPFLFVQLANLNEAKPAPSDSDWAELREAQAAALSLSETAMAVAIDVGEWNDIHPLNKMAVGERLAAAARAVAYDESITYSGPQYRSMTVKGQEVVLSFDHVGSGLTVNAGDSPQGFAIAGEDGNFVWAQAEIQGDQVVVRSDQVKEPVAVRYAWADNPAIANLFNKDGFPAAPFRTDP